MHVAARNLGGIYLQIMPHWLKVIIQKDLNAQLMLN